MSKSTISNHEASKQAKLRVIYW